MFASSTVVKRSRCRRGLLVDEAQVVVNVAEVRHEVLGDRPERASLERVDRRE
jgi:hypothetical protein